MTKSETAVMAFELLLGEKIPPPIRAVWMSSPPAKKTLLKESLASVMSLAFVEAVTPMNYLPLARLSEGSTVGLFFIPGASAPAVAVQDFEMNWVDLVTTQISTFVANPAKYIKNTTHTLASTDKSSEVIDRKLVPGFAGSMNESDLYKSWWLATTDFRYEAQKHFAEIVNSYSLRPAVHPEVRGVFRSASDFGNFEKWRKCVAVLVKAGKFDVALQVAENWRAVYLSGLKGFESTWPKSYDDAGQLREIAKSEVQIAKKVGRKLAITILSKVAISELD